MTSPAPTHPTLPQSEADVVRFFFLPPSGFDSWDAAIAPPTAEELAADPDLDPDPGLDEVVCLVNGGIPYQRLGIIETFMGLIEDCEDLEVLLCCAEMILVVFHRTAQTLDDFDVFVSPLCGKALKLDPGPIDLQWVGHNCPPNPGYPCYNDYATEAVVRLIEQGDGPMAAADINAQVLLTLMQMSWFKTHGMEPIVEALRPILTDMHIDETLYLLAVCESVTTTLPLDPVDRTYEREQLARLIEAIPMPSA